MTVSHSEQKVRLRCSRFSSGTLALCLRRPMTPLTSACTRVAPSACSESLFASISTFAWATLSANAWRARCPLAPVCALMCMSCTMKSSCMPTRLSSNASKSSRSLSAAARISLLMPTLLRALKHLTKHCIFTADPCLRSCLRVAFMRSSFLRFFCTYTLACLPLTTDCILVTARTCLTSVRFISPKFNSPICNLRQMPSSPRNHVTISIFFCLSRSIILTKRLTTLVELITVAMKSLIS
mmetsp:Transcript_884/g.1968  ORF Transcript_884/g.1968 Transcript_884/m.1968 type:complete len:240 (-) Transcript_884:280-999(-)